MLNIRALNSVSRLWSTRSLASQRRLIFNSGLFDQAWYKLAHPYVVRDRVDAATHFLMYGRDQRLSPGPRFDAGRYLDQHQQAWASGFNPLVHYLRVGKAAALETHPAPPSGADRILASGLFDPDWYLARYPDVAAARYPALLHYLVHGWQEGRATSADFDGEWYLRRYPDIVGIDPLLHFVDHGLNEGRKPLAPKRALEVARSTLASVEDLDPDLYSHDHFIDDDRLEVVNGVPRHRLAKAFKKIISQLGAVPETIVFLPWIVHGGADLVAGHAAKALVEAHGLQSVLIIIADHDRQEAPHLMPPGVKIISLPRIDPALSLEERISLADLLIRSLRPSSVLNVNSQACWEVYKRHGRRLGQFSRLYAMLFCPDYSLAGRRSGYSDLYLRSCLPFLTAVYSDNRMHLDEMAEQFSIPADLRERLVPLYQPAPPLAAEAMRVRDEKKPLRVLWAGRFAMQKNVDLLIAIAEKTPSCEFHIWGRGDHGYEAKLKALSSRLGHVNFHGPFDRFQALPLASYDTFLYTSRWDGIPNVLLEAAAAGLPIVASHVGGIGELVDAETGWLIDDIDDPDSYIEALRTIAADSEGTLRTTRAMAARLVETHSWPRYREVLTREPLHSGGLLHGSANDNGGAERPSRGPNRQAVSRELEA